jgi:UDP-glucose 4-epimerase
MLTDRSGRPKTLDSGTVLLTGAAGTIGRFVSIALAQSGYRTINVDDFSRGRPRSSALVGPVQDAPLTRDAIEAVVAQHRPVAVVHFAGARPQPGELTAAIDRDPNFVGTWQLLNGLASAGVAAVVLASSSAVYGPGYRLVSEDAPLHPVSVYGRAKLAAEQLLRQWGEAKPGRRWAILRLANAAGADASRMLGWFENDRTLIPAVIAAAAGQRSAVQVLGTTFPTSDGTAVRDYIHYWDIARATVCVLRHLLACEQNEIFNVASGQGTSVAAVIGAAQKITKRAVHVEQHPAHAMEIPELVLSPERLAQVAKFVPVQSNIETIVGSAWDWHQAVRVSPADRLAHGHVD